MFSILPFALSFQLGILPVEMWSTIFRFLDTKSLLAAARSHKLWLNVCRGDPVLRRRLHCSLKEEKNYFHNVIVNPKISTCVTREFPSRKYGINVQKSVSNCGDYVHVLCEKKPLLSYTEKHIIGKRTNKLYNKKRYSPYRV
ncbi:hypothetical protein NQ314_004778 [Rhamnusium bicolor]|uniref:F-box domain-containing protein n=1 Tax=Rhamnusium bicolor TaxID=1586634 RepID=A0AAV8ZIQ9_9CUCU|nr:hypothetical protein NQ314_004778 [Rhamnusium bicolor]